MSGLTEQGMRDITDQIYLGLFGKTANQLRAQLGLPLEDTVDDDNLRDHMGIEALNALAEVEGTLGKALRAFSGTLTTVQAGAVSRELAELVGVDRRKQAAEKGVDFLTDEPLIKEV